MDLLQLFLGQIPEAIFFALFMIYTKQLKEKRILFIFLMIVEYLLLKIVIRYNIWFQILYTFTTYIILKVLYKEKTQITDIFTFTIANIILIFSCFILYFIVWKTVNNYIFYVVLNRIILVLFFITFHNKLHKIQLIYKNFWNRNDKKKNKIKATTFRALNVVAFNIIFYIINIGMIFTLFIGRSV